MSPQTTVATAFEISDGTTTATVRKLLTPRGQLVEVESATDVDTPAQIRIDALGLESLSWQAPEELAERFDCNLSSEVGGETASTPAVESFEISNEYADAVVAKMATSTGETLAVRSPVKRTELQLSAPMLRELALCETDLFSEFLETPHGPHDH